MQEKEKSRKRNYLTPESRNHEIHWITCQNHENHANLMIPLQNHENQEIHRITIDNNENHKKFNYSTPESRKS